jgi:hypothetical protein
MNDERRFEERRYAGKDPAPERDDLDDALGAWAAPDVPPSLDRRVLASFRELSPAQPFWVRFFTATVRVPVPVAAAAVVLLLLSAAIVLKPQPSGLPAASGVGSPTRAADRAEAPVVTRTSLAGFQPTRESGGTIVLEGALQ